MKGIMVSSSSVEEKMNEFEKSEKEILRHLSEILSKNNSNIKRQQDMGKKKIKSLQNNISSLQTKQSHNEPNSKASQPLFLSTPVATSSHMTQSLNSSTSSAKGFSSPPIDTTSQIFSQSFNSSTSSGNGNNQKIIMECDEESIKEDEEAGEKISEMAVGNG